MTPLFIPFVILQLTWGIFQNALGAVIRAILLIKNPKRQTSRYHGAFVTNWNNKGSMSLGLFIFNGHHDMSESFQESVLAHEFGHSIQSIILGPLFLPVIGVPSSIWAACFAKYRKKHHKAYSAFYPEKWANHLAIKVIHGNPPTN